MPDIRRVVTFGTSLTACGGWQQRLSVALGLVRGHEVEVETIAEPGRDSRWALANVERVIARAPDMVLAEFAANDASLLHFMSVRESGGNMKTLMSRIQKGVPGAIIFIMAMNPVWGHRALIRPRLRHYCDRHAQIARDMGVGFVDHRPAWEKFSPAEIRRVIPDGGHPKPAVAEQLIVPAILAALDAWRAS